MAGNKYSNSEAKNQQWIKSGRGSGQGSEYKPWLTVRDLPSEGRSHRIFGYKSQRPHHLLSDLELAVFMSLGSVDISEINFQQQSLTIVEKKSKLLMR